MKKVIVTIIFLDKTDVRYQDVALYGFHRKFLKIVFVDGTTIFIKYSLIKSFSAQFDVERAESEEEE